MKTAREIWRDDANRTFLNAEEFATAHNVDGVNILCVMDEVRQSNSRTPKFEGLYEMTHILFTDESKLPKKPVPGAKMKIDNVLYHVVFIEPDNFGMTEIHLRRQSERNFI